jgi:AraC family transcriptional regulator
VPPHQYVLTRRVERAQPLPRNSDLSLVDIAASAGFSDQSKLSAHFKRVLGVTPRQFRQSARSAQNSASLAKTPAAAPPTIPP